MTKSSCGFRLHKIRFIRGRKNNLYGKWKLLSLLYTVKAKIFNKWTMHNYLTNLEITNFHLNQQEFLFSSSFCGHKWQHWEQLSQPRARGRWSSQRRVCGRWSWQLGQWGREEQLGQFWRQGQQLGLGQQQGRQIWRQVGLQLGELRKWVGQEEEQMGLQKSCKIVY